MPKKSIDDQIQERINCFVDELSGLMRNAALEAVQQALGGDGGSSRALASKRISVRPGKRPKKPGQRVRRTNADLEADKAALAAYVTANPGQRLEEIADGLAISSKDLKRPALLLLGERALRKEGERRGTRYFSNDRGNSRAGTRKKESKAGKARKKSSRKRA